ncbi:hypothetical protein ACT40Y_02010 [Acinetobacter baumannii]|nr:hypothetical protein [Acinetobacter baumannii]
MDKCREEFEKQKYWIGLFRDAVDFDEELGRYVLNGQRKLYAFHLDSFNEKWAIWQEAWQHQQAKVDELQKQLSEYIFVAETLDEMYVKEVQKSDELQKQVEAFKDHAAMLRSAAKSYAYTEREQNILLSQADDIEKILGLEQRPNGEEQ